MNERRMKVIAAGVTYLVIEFSTLIITGLVWLSIIRQPEYTLDAMPMGSGPLGRSFVLPQLLFVAGTAFAIYAAIKEYRRVSE